MLVFKHAQMKIVMQEKMRLRRKIGSGNRMQTADTSRTVYSNEDRLLLSLA